MIKSLICNFFFRACLPDVYIFRAGTALTQNIHLITIRSELQNHFKYDLKSNQNQFIKYDFHPIKIIFLKLILNQNQNHEKIDCNQFKSLT